MTSLDMTSKKAALAHSNKWSSTTPSVIKAEKALCKAGCSKIELAGGAAGAGTAANKQSLDQRAACTFGCKKAFTNAGDGKCAKAKGNGNNLCRWADACLYGQNIYGIAYKTETDYADAEAGLLAAATTDSGTACEENTDAEATFQESSLPGSKKAALAHSNKETEDEEEECAEGETFESMSPACQQKELEAQKAACKAGCDKIKGIVNGEPNSDQPNQKKACMIGCKKAIADGSMGDKCLLAGKTGNRGALCRWKDACTYGQLIYGLTKDSAMGKYEDQYLADATKDSGLACEDANIAAGFKYEVGK